MGTLCCANWKLTSGGAGSFAACVLHARGLFFFALAEEAKGRKRQRWRRIIFMPLGPYSFFFCRVPEGVWRETGRWESSVFKFFRGWPFQRLISWPTVLLQSLRSSLLINNQASFLFDQMIAFCEKQNATHFLSNYGIPKQNESRSSVFFSWINALTQIAWPP